MAVSSKLSLYINKKDRPYIIAVLLLGSLNHSFMSGPDKLLSLRSSARSTNLSGST